MAQAVAIGFTSLILSKMYEELTSALESLEPGDVSHGRLVISLQSHRTGLLKPIICVSKPNMKDTLDKLKETHATSAGLKVS